MPRYFNQSEHISVKESLETLRLKKEYEELCYDEIEGNLEKNKKDLQDAKERKVDESCYTEEEKKEKIKYYEGLISENKYLLSRQQDYLNQIKAEINFLKKQGSYDGSSGKTNAQLRSMLQKLLHESTGKGDIR